MTEALVVALVLLVAVAIVGLLIRRILGGSAEVNVAEEFVVGGAAHDHAAALSAGLRSMRGSRFRESGPGRYVVSVFRSPNWTLALLPLFGLGFILSILLSKEWQLHVSLYDSDGGARVRLDGLTERRVLDRVRSVVSGS